ncbi:hypothetical protein AB3M83_03705 [Microbacterium sp. 179-B 1A2 NHS]|uniref:hypothetical protein n=1 Tax=Microbacterium sp. 179-B 1A2 NHS TaxID=3142383 RepID=UPI0039A2A487
MSRIEVSYGGQSYSIGDRTLAEVHEEIRRGVLAGHHWLQVNEGGGQPRPAFLSITPGVPIAIIPQAEPRDPPPDPQPFEEDDDMDAASPGSGAGVWRGPTIHAERRNG